MSNARGRKWAPITAQSVRTWYSTTTDRAERLMSLIPEDVTIAAALDLAIDDLTARIEGGDGDTVAQMLVERDGVRR
ncbi:MAG: hypothetical protein ACO3UW_12925 [Candidatus Nanopelagicales bacterium]